MQMDVPLLPQSNASSASRSLAIHQHCPYSWSLFHCLSTSFLGSFCPPHTVGSSLCIFLVQSCNTHSHFWSICHPLSTDLYSTKTSDNQPSWTLLPNISRSLCARLPGCMTRIQAIPLSFSNTGRFGLAIVLSARLYSSKKDLLCF